MDNPEAEASFGGGMESNFTPFITEVETKTPPYEQLLADVWVGIVLTMLLLSCVCCMCSCLVYHKFQQWKRSVLRNNEEPEIISNVGVSIDCESLPSYTIASGLPSYEEALCQLEIIKK
ncbi:UNVERIFIED_CONTAM: hypothetical protein PYX00_006128 [Menopon gallinae]|uniref:Uncharacterized protein n=1 Tax=Menopon gallinae TaxID=328185 RepID=A0AAW2HUC7_9NEOP